ncbi:hypothetical protein O9X90_02010 [Agrobacterium leguminum]|uniref:hypothetical protein n=1 Tax=Agrobacterium leguminum TaxID=2792015 RepID=UPI0022B80FAF|nr:hypothetical protein [Agrobacterium leguminum]MCZ7931072.1 hypothetical protein [Agrobacterium leguminum]
MDLEEYIDTLSPNVKPEGFAKSLMYELIKDEISEVVRGRDGLSLPDYVFLANAPELLSVDDAIDVFEQSNQTIFPLFTVNRPGALSGLFHQTRVVAIFPPDDDVLKQTIILKGFGIFDLTS